MPYFDLHCHPGLKTLFLPQDGQQFSAWHTIDAPNLFGDILSSQCSLEQLSRNGDIPLVCITLHAPEAGMIDQFVIRLAAATLFRAFMDPERLREMYSGIDGYQQVFSEELTNLLKGPADKDQVPAGKKVLFLKDWNDYDPGAQDTVHVVFNIEGGHNLYDIGDTLADPQKALYNLKAFIDKGFLTLYLTPTHLTPNAFVNHAYGNKILTKGPLLPQGLGITAAGKSLIDYAYANNILIDVKHMSLVSRLQFYHIHNRFYPNKPIVASHMGLTGMPVAEYLGWARRTTPIGPVVEVMSYKYQWQQAGVSFYPLSINLFSEDVIAILNSGGLIGLSMDVRILGAKDDNGTPQFDYLSTAEYNIIALEEDARTATINQLADDLWAGATPVPPRQQDIPATPDFTQAVAAEATEILPLEVAPTDTRPNFEAHAKQLAASLLKILDITRLYALPHPWNNVCIGSDFDGLVEAVDCCKNATEFSQLVPALIHELEAGAEATGLDLQIPAAQIVDQFCYTNAFNFLNKHFGG